MIWSPWACWSLLLYFYRKQASSYTSPWAEGFPGTSQFLLGPALPKLRRHFTANRNHHPWAWGLPGQQRGHTLASVDRSHDRNSWKISPSWGLSSIHSRKLELHLSLRLSKYLGYPLCLTACFSWAYATLITLADLYLFVRLDWNRLTGSEVIGVAQTYIHKGW